MKTRITVKYVVSYCIWRLLFDCNPRPDPFKLNFLDNFCNSKVCHTVLTKIRAIKQQKNAKI